ncbi:hypothetical protein GJ496_000672 [Pomphorhynchus laevis]|nr:hypothetical protein GJ496_000672 [Pomphorhynchus laevis]
MRKVDAKAKIKVFPFTNKIIPMKITKHELLQSARTRETPKYLTYYIKEAYLHRQNMLACLYYAGVMFAGFAKYSSADNISKVPGCSRTCTTHDGSIECWSSVTDFFTYQLVRSLRDTASLLLYLNVMSAVQENKVNISEMVHTSIIKNIKELSYEHEEEHENINKEQLENITILILNSLEDFGFFNNVVDYTELPSLECLTPADYPYRMWKTIAILTIILFILTVILTMAYCHIILNKRTVFSLLVK